MKVSFSQALRQNFRIGSTKSTDICPRVKAMREGELITKCANVHQAAQKPESVRKFDETMQKITQQVSKYYQLGKKESVNNGWLA